MEYIVMIVETTNFLATLQYFCSYLRVALVEYFLYCKRLLLNCYEVLSKESNGVHYFGS
ncbi:hypothetical protein ERO13_A06G032672v2 [Gossypium hirsutum]|uniref:Uncharacterized protein n=1 Tax=Gossypium darwinii TaxID=34276 RepID=A0A5D2G1L7_GOSDA|nr:hypothetical protein ERO13_A06G032672v2 [Gossypium hirsutum]TYH12095.1 hypothetical protein ES288_A06G038900v1 [Gossypium darwinii]